jgi:F-type H+-transporting ATPase subunit a
MAHNPLEHVLDQTEWVIFESLGISWQLPSFTLFGHKFQVTKFMILELIAAGLIIAIFVPLARRAARDKLPRGPWWNGFESLLTFIRDEVARPNMGDDADRYVPFLWSMFIFILFCNLLGMIPLMGSPTASISMTAGLALVAFVMMHGAAIVKMGPIHYVMSLWPHIEIMPMPGRAPGGHDDHGHGEHSHGHDKHPDHAPAQPSRPVAWWEWPLWLVAFLFGLVISAMIFVIELVGTVIKSGVLAIRLFANMFAGHTVLAMILLLLVAAGQTGLTLSWGGVTVISVLGTVALSLLELFVAFLQAYVFVFLTSLFMGMALNPSH